MAEKETVTVQLVGGLGNQLFGFFAGAYLEESTGKRVVYDDSIALSNTNHHGSSIRSFGFDNNFGADHHGKNPAVKALRFLLWPALRRTQAGRSTFASMFRFYKSETIGFDPKLVDVPVGRYISGYFQTFRYFEDLRNASLKNLMLKNPSLWFQDLSRRAELEAPIMIHIRRGDYAQATNSYFGQLSTAYFLEAVEILKTALTRTDSVVWVFSDAIDEVRKEFELAGITDFRWIKSPVGADPAEELLLMSMGAGLAISNSTFSWWAGMVGKRKPVVAPSKWFQHKPDPQDLIPPTWLRCESKWK